ANAALRNVAAQRFAPRSKVLNLNAVFCRPIERNLDAIFIVQGNAKARAKLPQLVLVEFLLLVRDVLPFARFAKPVALDGAREDHRRSALMFYCLLVRVFYFVRLVPAEAQTPQACIG